MEDGTFKWFAGVVRGLSGHGKSKGKKRKRHADWIDVAFEDGQTVGVLLPISAEGDVWCRAHNIAACKAKTAKENAQRSAASMVTKKVPRPAEQGKVAAGGQQKKGPSRRYSNNNNWSDVQERTLRNMLKSLLLAQIPPPEDGSYHAIYRPGQQKRSKSKEFQADWHALAKRWKSKYGPGQERTNRCLSKKWSTLFELSNAPSTPKLSLKASHALGLCPGGVALARKGARLPLTRGEAALIMLVSRPDDVELLAKASQHISSCPSCLTELISQVGKPETLLGWMQTHKKDTAGQCRICRQQLAESAELQLQEQAEAEKRALLAHTAVSARVIKKPTLASGDQILHRFELKGVAGERWRWYEGEIKEEAKGRWKGWYHVAFEDGETLVVKLSQQNEGSVWRRYDGSTPPPSAPPPPSFQSTRGVAAIKSTVQVVPKAAEKIAAEAEEAVKVGREALAAAQEESSSESSSEEDEPGSGVWTEQEDRLLIECLGRHTELIGRNQDGSNYWGWNDTSEAVGRSLPSCRSRAVLLKVKAAKVKCAVKPGHTGRSSAPGHKDEWSAAQDALLRSNAALHLNEKYDKPGKRRGQGKFMFSWAPIAVAVGRQEVACRARVKRLIEMTGEVGTLGEKLECRTCKMKFKSYRGALTHNGTSDDCAHQRGYWFCRLCCKPFQSKSGFRQHEKTCTTRVKSRFINPHQRPAGVGVAAVGSASAKGGVKGDPKLESSSSAAAAAAGDKGKRPGPKQDGNGWERSKTSPQPQLHVVSSSFFMSENVEKRMRKHTWQCKTTDEERLGRWSTARMPVVVRHTGTIKGFGAFASRAIRPSEMIGEYAGEIIDQREIERRAKRYSNGTEIRISAYHDGGVAGT